jgi:alpha-glucosidase (family GH31 glycosyl hydrolase)
VWVPPGEWYDVTTGAINTGDATKGTVITRTYNLDEIPVFAKGGAAVVRHPMAEVQRDPIGRSGSANEHLEFTVYPTSGPTPATTGTSTVYEVC